MTLPASGAISFNAINVELGVAGATQASLGQTSYRNLSGVASGQISMSNFYGKANQFAFSIAGGNNVNLRTAAVNAGWNQASQVVATITANVGSTSTGTAAMTIAGSFPGGLAVVINSGVSISGRGGNGGNGNNVGAAGGLALSVSSAVTVTNNGVVAGGGGGGGGGYNTGFVCGESGSFVTTSGGGGGGGGAGNAGGSGGTNAWNNASPTGGAGTLTNGGAGGASLGTGAGNSGGAGGGRGAAGSAAAVGRAGGAAGACTSGNLNITWAVTGSRFGALN